MNTTTTDHKKPEPISPTHQDTQHHESRQKKVFSLIFPAPNPTGELHLGHMLNITIQDLLARWKRLSRHSVYWTGALDHGGISTQTVVERQIRDLGQDPRDLKPDEKAKAIREWQDAIGETIRTQMRDIQASIDLTEKRTISDSFNEELISGYFYRLYRKGLIYRDRTIVNWCTHCRSSIGDMELDLREEENEFYLIAFGLEDDSRRLNILTKNPNTLMADVALGVNMNDERHRDLIGRYASSPFDGRRLPIIPTKHVDQTFGQGIVRITPAFIAQDFLLAKEKDLPITDCIDDLGRIVVGRYKGFTPEQAMQLILDELRRTGALLRSEWRMTGNAYCKYCGTKIIAKLSTQWFLKMEPLTENGLDRVRRREVRIYPNKYEPLLEQWLSTMLARIRQPQKWWEGHCMAVQRSLSSNADWCISRQIQCGNTIPAVICHECGNETVYQRVKPAVCAHCGSRKLADDESVIDMWLSCALWCFCANKNLSQDENFLRHLARNAVCVTGFDLLFLWIAITILLARQLDEPIPFTEVVVHPVITDGNGKKMSKSLGNVIVPNEILRQYGPDALRLALLQNLDLELEAMPFSQKTVEENSDILRQLCQELDHCLEYGARLGAGDQQITACKRYEDEVNKALAEFRFQDAYHVFKDYVLHRLPVKVQELNQRGSNPRACEWLVDVLSFLHPFVPLITESYWQRAFPDDPAPFGS